MNRKLQLENEHFVSLAHRKQNWKDFEIELSKEKEVSRKLITLINDEETLKIAEKGKQNTYKEYSRSNSNFDNYCGSPLSGNNSPVRSRTNMAGHVTPFGNYNTNQ